MPVQAHPPGPHRHPTWTRATSSHSRISSKYKKASGGNAEPLDPEVGRRCHGRRGLSGALRGLQGTPPPGLAGGPSAQPAPPSLVPEFSGREEGTGGLRCHNENPCGLKAAPELDAEMPRLSQHGSSPRPSPMCSLKSRRHGNFEVSLVGSLSP